MNSVFRSCAWWGLSKAWHLKGMWTEMHQREGTSEPREWGLDCQAKECGFCPGKREEGLGDDSSKEGEEN